MSGNKYVLAMYDIRGKQDFIYRSSKMKEIIGASYMIRDCFEDYLFPAARTYSKEEKGIFTYKSKGGRVKAEDLKDRDKIFSRENFERHKNEGYVGEVVYDGGGNFWVLYKDLDTYREINKRFYREVLEGTYSLKVLSSYIEGVDFEDFPGDRQKLYALHRKNEQKEDMLHPVNALPIVQVDYRSSLPLAAKQKIGNGPDEKVSYESKRKYDKYAEVMSRKSYDRNVEGNRILDELVTEKGEESLLAVIYIDGNNMGAKVQKCLGNSKSYKECVQALREFSAEIQKNYIDDRIDDVDELLDKIHEKKNGQSSKKADEKNQDNDKEKKDGSKERRFVVYAGDEVTFICNARNAYRIAKNYLKKLEASNTEGEPRTSCAGIAIFHSHAPFADAYRIAEECCESGKQWMKAQRISNASLLDFHYCQGAIGVSLEEIRRQEETAEDHLPWLICGDNSLKEEKKAVTEEQVKAMQEQLVKAGRSNIKNLLFSAKKSEADFAMELERIRAHQTEKGIDFTLGGELKNETVRQLIYDMVMVYDLWFADSDEKEA